MRLFSVRNEIMQDFPLFLILATCFVLSLCCKNDDKHCNVFEWSYEGDEGPDDWSGCYAECSGNSQSPVNIAGANIDASLAALDLHYEDVQIHLDNNGHTIEFEYESGSTLTLHGIIFNLRQFHFHTESEHTISGDHHPMEVHLVHKHDATGQLVVIGIFFEEGNENVFLQYFTDSLPASKDEHFISGELVNALDLFPVDESYYTYSGSLTTPPCSENVTWLVMKTPVEASVSQIQKFQDIMHENNRPVQALKGRTIREHQ